MEKRQRQKIWKRLKTMFKVLLILIFLALLIQFIADLLNQIDFLAQRVTEQNNTIDQLTQQLHTVSDTNVQLNDQLQYAQQQLDLANLKIDELTNAKLTQQVPQVNIGGQPVVMTVDDIKAEVEPQLKFPATELPIVVVGVMTILKSLLFRIPVL